MEVQERDMGICSLYFWNNDKSAENDMTACIGNDFATVFGHIRKDNITLLPATIRKFD